MYYYVYKIVNKVNGCFYIGKRKHPNPYKDFYMGSGKLIIEAIKKHGKENFNKEIIEIFSSDNEAAFLEKHLVNEKTIKNPKCYNLREGGHGGFFHINSLDPENRINIKSLKEKISKGELKCGGDKSKYFTEATYEKLRNASKKGNDKLRELRKYDPEKFKISNDKISKFQVENNSMKNKIWIRKDKDKKVIHKDLYEKYKSLGWLNAIDYKNGKIKKMKKRWVNNKIVNKLIEASDYEIYLNLNWFPGRL